MQEDYYAILEVEKTATVEVIKKAYRQKAMQFHPDRNPGDTVAEEKFKACTEAYECPVSYTHLTLPTICSV